MEDEEFRSFMRQINTKLDDILDKLSAIKADVMGDSLTLSQRLTKLEDELRSKREE